MNALRTAFHRLAQLDTPHLVYCAMDDGTDFVSTVPVGRDNDELQLNFNLDKVARVGLLHRFGFTPYDCDLDKMHELLKDIAGLRLEYGHLDYVGDVLWM